MLSFEEIKCHSGFQEGQKGGSEELQSLVLRKVTEHVKGREVTEKSKNGLQRSKLFLIILIAFYKDMIGVVDKD